MAYRSELGFDVMKQKQQGGHGMSLSGPHRLDLPTIYLTHSGRGPTCLPIAKGERE